MPKQKESNNPSSTTLLIPIPVHLLPPLFCSLSISSTDMNQIWKLFQLKSTSHHVFLFVGGFLLGWMHIKIQSKKKLTRLFTSLLTHLHCHSFALVQSYNTASQNLKTNCKKIPRRHKKYLNISTQTFVWSVVWNSRPCVVPLCHPRLVYVVYHHRLTDASGYS